MNIERILKGAALATLSALCLSSCLSEQPHEGCPTCGLVDVPFLIEGSTRSSVTVDDKGIGTFELLAYCNGRLYDAWYASNLGSGTPSLKLHTGNTYTFYALANVGSRLNPDSEADIAYYAWDLSSGFSTLNEEGIPMCWSLTKSLSSAQPITISLDRLVSKWTFSLDRSELPQLVVESVRMRQAASFVYPFDDSAKATSANDNGDRATSADVALLNAESPITFYVPENRQGTLLPSNTSSYGKTYDALVSVGKSAQAALCTYLELTCSFDQSEAEPPYDGEIIYRFYLGKNMTSNFDIERNTAYDITIRPTAESPTSNTIIWEVDNSGVTVNDWVKGDITYSHTPAVYNGQWGYFDFPEASSSSPVTVLADPDGEEVVIPVGSTGTYKTSAGDYDLYYNSTINPHRLWYCNMDYVDYLHGGMVFMMSQEGKSTRYVNSGGCRLPMKVIVDGWLSFAEMDDDPNAVIEIPEQFSVSESGVNQDVFVTLADHTGSRVLDLRTFLSPEGYSSQNYTGLYDSHSSADDYFDCSESWISSSRSYAFNMDFKKTTDDYDRPINSITRGVPLGRNYLYDAVIYGLDALDATHEYPLILESDSHCCDNYETSVVVTPVVCDLRNIGKVLNNQLAFATLGEDVSTNSFMISDAGNGCSFTVLSLEDETALCENRQSAIATMLSGSSSASAQMSVSYNLNLLSVAYKTPTRTVNSSYDFDSFSHHFSCGQYALVSTVTNPYNNRTFYERCFLMNVVLHIPVGLCVSELTQEDSSSSSFYLCAMPWTLNYSDKRAYRLWEFVESMPGIISYDRYSNLAMSYNSDDSDMSTITYSTLPLAVGTLSSSYVYGMVWSSDINTIARGVYYDMGITGASTLSYADGVTLSNAREVSFSHDRQMRVVVTLADPTKFPNSDYFENCYVFEHYKRNYWLY